MKKMTHWIFTLFIMFSLTQILAANEEEVLKDHFLDKLQEVKVVVQNKKISKEKKFEDVISILTPTFDFELMAKLSLGKKNWNKLSKSDQLRFVSIYTDRMKKSYSAKLDSYNDQIIKITSVVKKKNRMFIKTYMESGNKGLDVVYKFYKPKKPKIAKDTWLIYDVEIVGISILKADKAQFKDFLQTKSLEDLMMALEEQD